MTPFGLNALGVVSQLVGVVVAFVGLWKTWHEFANGERFLAPYEARAGAIAHAISVRVRSDLRRLLRRHPETIARAGTAHGTFTMSANIRGRVTWGPLPLTTEAAMAELERRTLELQKTHANTTERQDDALAEVRGDAATFRAHADEAIKRLEAMNRRVAVGGLRWQASGLFLVLLGLALQGIAAALGSGPAPVPPPG